MTQPAITLTPIRTDEHSIALALKVHPHQSHFVASNEYSLKQAAEQPECVPMLIRHNGEPVGFAMHALAPEDNEHWIYRFMIDRRFQQAGIGRAALDALTQHMFATLSCPRILLSIEPGNDVARKLYEQAGFVATGTQIEGEDVFILERDSR